MSTEELCQFGQRDYLELKNNNHCVISPETSIRNNSCPFSTVSPSATSNSTITPATGELTGNAVCREKTVKMKCWFFDDEQKSCLQSQTQFSLANHSVVDVQIGQSVKYVS